jgi:phosphoribosylformimino-5-aminoimidazole carboxamide ribonucleotide (ProFAR) isomerase
VIGGGIVREKRLRRLRELAFNAGILGSSKMDESRLLEALAESGRIRRPVIGPWRIRPIGRPG